MARAVQVLSIRPRVRVSSRNQTPQGINARSKHIVYGMLIFWKKNTHTNRERTPEPWIMSMLLRRRQPHTQTPTNHMDLLSWVTWHMVLVAVLKEERLRNYSTRKRPRAALYLCRISAYYIDNPTDICVRDCLKFVLFFRRWYVRRWYAKHRYAHRCLSAHCTRNKKNRTHTLCEFMLTWQERHARQKWLYGYVAACSTVCGRT